MKKKSNILIVILILIFSLVVYFILRMQAIKNADIAVDNFFAEFRATTNQDLIMDRVHLVDQNLADALAIMEKHKDAIMNFDYKNTTPLLNLSLNEANVPVSWHLTVFFKKENSGWYVSKFDEYISDQN